MTALGSPPFAAAHEVGAGPLGPQPSCSAAAARNVSPAAITTVCPSASLALADLADGGGLADAVHPDEQPHVGSSGLVAKRRGRPGEPLLHLGLERVEQRRAVGEPSSLTRARSASSSSVAGPTPTSARMSASSSSSQVSSSIFDRDEDRADVPAEQRAGLAEPIAERGLDGDLGRRFGRWPRRAPPRARRRRLVDLGRRLDRRRRRRRRARGCGRRLELDPRRRGRRATSTAGAADDHQRRRR